jgi:DNA repair protein RecO (recombination protein O)
MAPPRVYTTDAFVLRRRNIGEADSIFTLFSAREGKFDAVARGVRKARSRMRGHIEPLTRSRVQLAHGRTLDVFTQAEVSQPYRAVREDLERTAAALYCAELLERSVAERQEAPELFALFGELLDALEAAGPLIVARAFEVHLLAATGYELQLDGCVLCDAALPQEETLLSPGAGGLVCRACRGAAGGGRLLSVRAIKVLRFAAGASLTDFARLRADEALHAELRAALGDVVRHVVERDMLTARYVDEVARLPRGETPA